MVVVSGVNLVIKIHSLLMGLTGINWSQYGRLLRGN